MSKTSQNNSEECPAVQGEREGEKKKSNSVGKSIVTKDSSWLQSTITVEYQKRCCCQHNIWVT